MGARFWLPTDGVLDYKALPGAGQNVSYFDQPMASYSYDTPEVAQKKAECKVILTTET